MQIRFVRHPNYANCAFPLSIVLFLNIFLWLLVLVSLRTSMRALMPCFASVFARLFVWDTRGTLIPQPQQRREVFPSKRRLAETHWQQGSLVKCASIFFVTPSPLCVLHARSLKKGRKVLRVLPLFVCCCVRDATVKNKLSVASAATKEEEGEDAFHTQPFRVKQSRKFATKTPSLPTKSRTHGFSDVYEKEVYEK